MVELVVSSHLQKAHALIIAISAYQSARKLPSAIINDAKDVASLLCSTDRGAYDPAKVKVLLDDEATGSAIRAELERLRDVAQPDETVLIYFSGHGSLDIVGGESRLLPVEASKENLQAIALSAKELSEALDAIRAGTVLVVIDACHAGGAATLKAFGETDESLLGFSEKSLALISAGAGRAVIASSKIDETSLVLDNARNSAFTTALLEGLRGAADFHKEGAVKVFGLFEYVSRRTPELTHDRQHPVLRTKLETNFVIALNRGASKGVEQEAEAAVQTMERSLADLMPSLYPAGPLDENVWERAGGDVSRIRLSASGRSQWFEALKLIAQGGGGNVSLRTLVLEARKDFPQNDALRAYS